MKEKRILNSSSDTQQNHRGGFETCPSCGFRADADKWDAAAVELIISPGCFKSNSVSVASECPKCFEKSWVHHRMAGFSFSDAWPEKWKERVETKENADKLAAQRAWGASLCWRCKLLKSGSVDTHAWRHCRKGSGPAETKCELFQELKP